MFNHLYYKKYSGKVMDIKTFMEMFLDALELYETLINEPEEFRLVKFDKLAIMKELEWKKEQEFNPQSQTNSII